MSNAIEIVCVGNELLIGKTLNTNAQWLAKRITTMGLNVKRIITIGDDTDEISQALKECLKRKPAFIITTGGLGPTFDDKTLEGIAKALNRKLETNQQALKMVEKKYRQYQKEGKIEKVELTPPRIKMATLPENSQPIENPIGTAPAVLTTQNNTTIIALPGVPSEMKAIFEESLMPLLRKTLGDMTFFETSLEVSGIMESDMAPLIDKVMHDNPYVYVKSHPKGEEKIPRIELHISTTAKNTQEAKERVSKTLIQISEMIQAKGGKIKPTKAKA
ncbi:MAG: nicotinamide mononucleotide deamidase-related protein [Candidatus Bathyarchaeia archaeon]